MKVNILDAHDRLQYLKKDDFGIAKNCQDIIDKRPFGPFPFYIYAHCRTIGLDEKRSLFNQDLKDYLALQAPRKYMSLDQVPEKRLIWQPRLTKPQSTPNTMLFKAYPGSDIIKIIWMLPQKELWGQYEKGNLTEHQLVKESIHLYKTDRSKLDAKENDDLSDEKIHEIYKELKFSCRENALMKRAYGLQN